MAGHPLPRLRAVGARAAHQAAARARCCKFWQRYLAGFETVQLPTVYARRAVPDHRGANSRFQIDARTTADLRRLARELRVSLFSVLLSAYYLTLRGFCYQDDIVVGTPFANRHHQQMEELVGVFVNTLPLR